MKPIRHVICPTDFSRFSERALRYAAVVAKWFGADLTVLFVLRGGSTPLPDVPPFDAPETADPAARKALGDRLRRFAEPAAVAGVSVRTEVAEGDIVATILAEARAPESLIVLGTHGHGGFENLVLGSVTEKVLRKAPCPVLTVPRETERGPTTAALLDRILCAVDFSPSSRAAFQAALDLAATSGAALSVVHVLRELPVAEFPELAHFNVPEYRRLLEKEARNRLKALVAERGSGRDVEIRILAGKPWRRILHLAHEIEADLIVLGVQGRSAADLLLFGSTAHHVVRTAPCPVLTVRTL
jgi:nucleotide-binding universal stress UspA family protein